MWRLPEIHHGHCEAVILVLGSQEKSTKREREPRDTAGEKQQAGGGSTKEPRAEEKARRGQSHWRKTIHSKMARQRLQNAERQLNLQHRSTSCGRFHHGLQDP